MRFRDVRSYVIAAVAVGLIAPSVLYSRVAAQKQGAPLWYSVVTVNRVKKTDRKPAQSAPKVQKAALLTLQWRLLERGNGNVKEEADPARVLHTGDQVKLAITTNQNGYLYVIQRMNSGDGNFVFPDPRINGGLNKVKKDQEYIVPSFCPSFPDPNDCWWEMRPPAGRENFIVVFSRDEFDKLPGHAAANNGDYEYTTIKRDLIEDLINSSRQKVKEATGRLTIPGKGAARFATRLQNINIQDNEELIATIQLRHAD
jgi:Domain of unknown function (DUF4384)